MSKRTATIDDVTYTWNATYGYWSYFAGRGPVRVTLAQAMRLGLDMADAAHIAPAVKVSL